MIDSSNRNPLNQEEPIQKPITQCYWAVPGQLLAGEYPGSKNPLEAEQKVQGLLKAGIRRFIDLTEPHDAGGLKPYEPVLARVAAVKGISITRLAFPLRDQSVPDTREHLQAVLHAIDEGLIRGIPTYVHCWGGRGRTGLVMACWFIRHGLNNREALDKVTALWKTVPKSALPGKQRSPEADVQLGWVLGWRP